jgi:hypothetical protein
MMPYIYNDEDNAPMNEETFDRDGHNPTVYLDAHEARMFKKHGEPEKPDNGCWNCQLYDGNHCTKEWNNLDPCYYIPSRDDKEPGDLCEDHEVDPIAVWEDFFGGNEP